MQRVRSLLVLVLLIVAAGIAGCGGSQSGSESGAGSGDAGGAVAQREGGPREIAIAVTENGFEPARPAIERGEAVTLVFTRQTDQTCATDVMFPRLDRKVVLPLNQAVRVDIPAGAVEDTLYFACGMNMITGQVTAR